FLLRRFSRDTSTCGRRARWSGKGETNSNFEIRISKLIMFSADTEARFKHLATIYPRKRSALIPMLLAAQKEHGYIKPETIEYVGKFLDLNPSEVDSIMSFYTLLRRHPVGKYHIMICTNLSCMLQGSDEIEACVKRKLGVDLGQVTPDGLF